MAIEEEEEIGIPEWVVTFGDMMSLLLTFFIMLVSLSEIKEEEKYQAMVESMQRVFGYDSSPTSMIPGSSKPRNSMIARLAAAGRAKRKDTMQGGDKVPAPTGENPLVEIVRNGERTAVGTKIELPESAVELNEENRLRLRALVDDLGGKPQKIEIRGHAPAKPLENHPLAKDAWDLAYQRCRAVKDFLVDVHNIDPARIRMSVAGPYEPLFISPDPERQLQNSRVEVYMLDELALDLSGTRTENQQRFTEGP